MAGRVPLALILLGFAVLFPAASAVVVEVPLPPSATSPLALAFGADGLLWITLDGSWALARYDPESNQTDLVPLAAPKSGEHDSLFGVRIGPDGAAWAGSGAHIHRVDARGLHASAYPLPNRTLLSGGIHVDDDGVVYYAEVGADRVVRLDPDTSRMTEILPPYTPFGPVEFAELPQGLYLTATYSGTYARLDATTDTLVPGPSDLILGPVGITRAGDGFWVAEMGGDSIALVDPSTNHRDRFPTTPSPYYEISGPSDVLVGRDGGVWFAEHFADRIARLDPGARTLHEYTIPSAPGTNVQRIAEAPDGAIWFAEWSKHRLGYVKHEPRNPGFSVPTTVMVKKGEAVSFDVTATGAPIPSGALLVGTGEASVRATIEGTQVTVDASNAAAGAYHVLVSGRQAGVNVGRYVTVTVTGGSSATIDVPLVFAAFLGALWFGRSRP